MRRLPSRVTVPALGVCLAVGLFTALDAAIAPAAVKRTVAVKPAASSKAPTIITVTAGKPSELAFKLSKTSMIPAGTVTFKVTNMGVAYHDFKICAKPVASAAVATNACTGKKTPTLKHGQSATLTLTLSKSGKYEFLCSVTGHALAGMKGLLGIGVAVTASEQKTAAKAGGTTGGGSTGGGGGSTGGGGTGGGGTGGGGTGSTGGEIGPAVGCPPGVTVKASGNADADGDELGTEPDDQDGCV
jgi:uncharacterized cupredoxin-like copper-binding protein